MLGLGYGSGYCVNFADVVPAYSGIVFGFANTFASLAGLTGNIVAGMIVTKPVLEQWRKLFVMFGIVYFVGGLIFLCFGSAVPRKWAQFKSVPDAQVEAKLTEEEAMLMQEQKTVKI
jgi:MFS family permease